jgi:LPXTG-site transpeptidase (sortase) family protein
MARKRTVARKRRVHKKRKIQRSGLKYKLIGLLFLVIALAILFLPQILIISKNNKNNSIQISPSLLTQKITQNNPVRILIPKANIDLNVVNARIINGYWELSENTASYGVGSGQLGDKGNVVIFAHAREGLFYNLKDIKVNDIIYVFNKDSWFRYKVNLITSVYPNQTEIITPTKTETLTLYTCTGFYDEKRLIVKALPENK